jgi:uncharacterized protein YndB with AHSA1/START domain
MTTTTHGSFIVERRYGAARERVFAAWSDPEAKRAWFAEGEGWDIRTYKLDFREGGSETSTFRVVGRANPFPPDTTFSNESVFNEIIPNERIIFTYSMARDGVRFSVSIASVELKPDGAGTRLIFSEHGAHLDFADGVKMREQGWRELLDKLDAYLAQGA